MLKRRDREKTINAIVYFAHNTNNLGKIKLFKLLYLLDFEHFKLTGRPVTGMQYHALPKGPVPSELACEWDQFDDDMSQAFEIKRGFIFSYSRQNVVPKTQFDDSHFTTREIRLLDELSNKYKNTCSQEMIDVTHAENGAWDVIWNNGLGRDCTIPYTLAISADDPNRDYILGFAKEYSDLQKRKSAKACNSN